jgi:GT2 family glycosyltransferase
LPHVTVVVLNWNGREDTLACLESLRALRYPDHRVLVVDNGSVDGSEAAVRERYPDVDFLQTGSNLGFAGGNNAGIAWALERGTDFVLLLNNDTEVDPDLLGPMVEAARDPEVGIVGASIAYHHDPRRLWAYGGGRFDVATGWVRHVQRPVAAEELRTRGTRHFYITGCTMLLRRRLLEEVGVLDTSYFHFCEDVDLCLRAEAAGWKVAVAGASRLLHKVSATTRVASPTFLYYNLRSRLTLARRHGPEGAPSKRAVAVLWLRLWRPALQSGQAGSGWRALRVAYADYLREATGPAPAELTGERT